YPAVPAPETVPDRQPMSSTPPIFPIMRRRPVPVVSDDGPPWTSRLAAGLVLPMENLPIEIQLALANGSKRTAGRPPTLRSIVPPLTASDPVTSRAVVGAFVPIPKRWFVESQKKFEESVAIEVALDA